MNNIVHMAHKQKINEADNKFSLAKKALINNILKRDPNIGEKELSILLRDIKRFASIVQKIYTEPQAQIKYKEVVKNGKKVKNRYIETNIEELGKLNRGTNEPITVKTFREFTQIITGNKNTHGE
jgi:hypothetical protein